SDERIRRFIARRARILAVVGLHGNTFKPHTGTKTSVLFLQSYTDEEYRERENFRSTLEAEFDTYAEMILEDKSHWQNELDGFESENLEALRKILYRFEDALKELKENRTRNISSLGEKRQRIKQQYRDLYVERQFNLRYDYPIFF